MTSCLMIPHYKIIFIAQHFVAVMLTAFSTIHDTIMSVAHSNNTPNPITSLTNANLCKAQDLCKALNKTLSL